MWTRDTPKVPGHYWLAMPYGATGWSVSLEEIYDDVPQPVARAHHYPLDYLWRNGALWWSERVVPPPSPDPVEEAGERARYAAAYLASLIPGENRRDAAHLRRVVKRMQEGKMAEALALAESLDTFVRDVIPSVAWEVMRGTVAQEEALAETRKRASKKRRASERPRRKS